MSAAGQDIAIIGAGLSGLCLALHLAKHDIKSTVYESRDAVYAHAGEIVVSPNASRVLDRVGIYEPLSKQGYNCERTTLWNRAGRNLGTLEMGSRFGYPSLRVRRSLVRDRLLEGCALAGVEIVYDRKLVKVEEIDGMVFAHFDKGGKVSVALLVGADGLRSSVRFYIDPKAKAMYTGVVTLYGCISSSELKHHMKNDGQPLSEPSMTYGREGTFTTWPRDYEGDEVGFFATVPVEDRSKDEWRKIGSDEAGLRQLLERSYGSNHWPEEIRFICRNAGELRMVPINKVQPVPSSWSSPSGKVILIGDAAHAIPPSSGQGGVMAFEDAETLAFAISKLGKNANALAEWQSHRRDRVQQVVDITNLAMKLRSASDWAFIQWCKESFLWALLKWKGPDGYRWMYGYDGASEMTSKFEKLGSGL